MWQVHAHISYGCSRARPGELRSGNRCWHWAATNYRMGCWRRGWWYDGLIRLSGLRTGNVGTLQLSYEWLNDMT